MPRALQHLFLSQEMLPCPRQNQLPLHRGCPRRPRGVGPPAVRGTHRSARSASVPTPRVPAKSRPSDNTGGDSSMTSTLVWRPSSPTRIMAPTDTSMRPFAVVSFCGAGFFERELAPRIVRDPTRATQDLRSAIHRVGNRLLANKAHPEAPARLALVSTNLFPTQVGTKASLAAIPRPLSCIAPQVHRLSLPGRSQYWCQPIPTLSEGFSLERSYLATSMQRTLLFGSAT